MAGVEEKLKSIMIILSGSLNNAGLYNRSPSLMAETDKNNFPHSQRKRVLIYAACAEAAEMMREGWQHKQNHRLLLSIFQPDITHTHTSHHAELQADQMLQN